MKLKLNLELQVYQVTLVTKAVLTFGTIASCASHMHHILVLQTRQKEEKRIVNPETEIQDEICHFLLTLNQSELQWVLSDTRPVSLAISQTAHVNGAVFLVRVRKKT